jgi:hypothetical protein
MVRAYTLATAALALGTSPKWLDNVLSHYTIPGVVQSRQGISRRLSLHGLIILGLTLILTQELGVPSARAIKIAETIAANEGEFVSGLISVNVGWTKFRTDLIERLGTAVEIAPLPKRGRPPENKTGRLE